MPSKMAGQLGASGARERGLGAAAVDAMKPYGRPATEVDGET